MRFYFGQPTNVLTADDQETWSRTFADVTFACGECGSEQTHEVAELVPTGTMHKVQCVEGHVTVGVPPTRYRKDSV